jgi:leucyl aminopeptidase
VTGRGNLGPEPNAPNTVRAGLLPTVCNDGSGTLFPPGRFVGSVERVMVYTIDGSAMAPGKQVRVDATVEARSSSDRIDIFATSDTTLSGWALIASVVPTRAGAQVISANYTLPAGGSQAVRIQLRYLGSLTTCAAGPYNDRDDLVFVTH